MTMDSHCDIEQSDLTERYALLHVSPFVHEISTFSDFV